MSILLLVQLLFSLIKLWGPKEDMYFPVKANNKPLECNSFVLAVFLLINSQEGAVLCISMEVWAGEVENGSSHPALAFGLYQRNMLRPQPLSLAELLRSHVLFFIPSQPHHLCLMILFYPQQHQEPVALPLLTEVSFFKYCLCQWGIQI